MCISRLMQDSLRTPSEKAGDWIEHVLRHGAQHLRGQAYNIPWYQYYLLDIMAFLVTIVTLVTMVVGLTCRCLCRVCRRKDESKTKKEWVWIDLFLPVCAFCNISMASSLYEMLLQRITIVWFAKTNFQSNIMNKTTMMTRRRILKSSII